MRLGAILLAVGLILVSDVWGEEVGKLPHLEFDAKQKQIRVECEALNCQMALEFFCVVTGTNEYESVLRSEVKPSDLHFALLTLGLKAGEPVRYSEGAKRWLAPHGPPLQISVQYEKEGKTIVAPAYRWMRNVKSKKEMPPMTWIFAGSRVMEDGKYAADVTGYIVSVVNFDLTVIDIPRLASSANETLEWEYNPDLVPTTGTKVWMIIEPAGKEEAGGQEGDVEPDGVFIAVDEEGNIELDGRRVVLERLTEQLEKMKSIKPVKVRLVSALGASKAQRLEKVIAAIRAAEVAFQRVTIPPGAPTTRISDVSADEAKIKLLIEKWNKAVNPHGGALREAAQAHYEVIAAMRREQQRLIDEADRIQRVIDELEKRYQELTTPRPEAE